MSIMNAFHIPLKEGESENQTVGCRHGNPEICAKNSMAGVCAFVREDGICVSPPTTWPKNFRALKEEKLP
jgi:hypothetical protein